LVSNVFSNGMYQLQGCGYHAVICHSDVAKVKKNIADGTK